MTEVMTLLTSATAHPLVKSFSGPDVIQQPFSTGKLFNVSEEPVSDLKSLSALLHRLEDDAIHRCCQTNENSHQIANAA